MSHRWPSFYRKAHNPKLFDAAAAAQREVRIAADSGRLLWVKSTRGGFLLVDPAGRGWDRTGQLVRCRFSTGVMIIVHPGSLCGSYHSHGSFQCTRLSSLLKEIKDWPGAFAIMRGAFFGEIARYAEIQSALRVASRASESRHYRADPTGPDLERVAARIQQDFNLPNRPVLVTGAWADPGDGCVTTVAVFLRRRNPGVKVSTFSPVSD